jgi:uncharacterized membrane protein
MANQAIGSRAGESARNLALINYGLLFASIFFAGLPALIAVIIAYSQRDEAPLAIRSHHDFQIRIFWVGFALTLLAAASVLGAAIGLVGELFEASRDEGWGNLGDLRIEVSKLTFDGTVVLMGGLAAIFSFLTCLWLAAAPAVGFIRLASARGMGHSAAP